MRCMFPFFFVFFGGGGHLRWFFQKWLSAPILSWWTKIIIKKNCNAGKGHQNNGIVVSDSTTIHNPPQKTRQVVKVNFEIWCTYKKSRKKLGKLLQFWLFVFERGSTLCFLSFFWWTTWQISVRLKQIPLVHFIFEVHFIFRVCPNFKGRLVMETSLSADSCFCSRWKRSWW